MKKRKLIAYLFVVIAIMLLPLSAQAYDYEEVDVVYNISFAGEDYSSSYSFTYDDFGVNDYYADCSTQGAYYYVIVERYSWPAWYYVTSSYFPADGSGVYYDRWTNQDYNYRFIRQAHDNQSQYISIDQAVYLSETW